MESNFLSLTYTSLGSLLTVVIPESLLFSLSILAISLASQLFHRLFTFFCSDSVSPHLSKDMVITQGLFQWSTEEILLSG